MNCSTRKLTIATATCSLLLAAAASAGPVYQPPGANLTLGDVTHGKRLQSASSNPAAAAADRARAAGKPVRGTVISGAAGLEYGNVQNLFDLYNELTRAYAPSDPGTGGGPGQDPDDKPDDGINLGDILDALDPQVQEALNAIAAEVATQAVLLLLIKEEGYAKAWLAADAPFVFDKQVLGGTWTFGVNWSGSSKAYGITEPIEFDRDTARQAIEDWINTLPIDRPESIRNQQRHCRDSHARTECRFSCHHQRQLTRQQIVANHGIQLWLQS